MRTAASGPAVSDVMLRHPKTLPTHASIGQARAALDNDHVHMVLLTETQILVGTLVRSDLPPAATGRDQEPALAYSTLAQRTVSPHACAASIQDLLNEQGMRRLAVIDTDGTLLGLMCLKRHRSGFCSDADVMARAGATTSRRLC